MLILGSPIIHLPYYYYLYREKSYAHIKKCLKAFVKFNSLSHQKYIKIINIFLSIIKDIYSSQKMAFIKENS